MKQFHLRISDSLSDQLEGIKKLTDAPSTVFVLREAVCLYIWYLKQVSRGREIIAISKDEEKLKKFEFLSPGIAAAVTKIAAKP